MSIVERLRRRKTANSRQDLCEEAAGEIESLRLQLAESQADLQKVTEQKNAMWFSLAECQARDAKRIEILKQIAEPETEVSFWWEVYARDALSLPNDDTCLNALITEAENRVAEACAKVYLETYGLTDIAEAIRSGEWRKHK